jgi:uncharacterized membrane protein YhaH (DUF805 family)
MENILNLFNGRISRGEYSRKFFLYSLYFIPIAIIAIIDRFTIKLPLSLLIIPIAPLLFIQISLSIKRLHDINKNGFLIFFPVIVTTLKNLIHIAFLNQFQLLLSIGIYSIFAYLLFIKEGTVGSNSFGEVPISLGEEINSSNKKARIFSLISLWMVYIPIAAVLIFAGIMSENLWILIILNGIPFLLFLLLNFFVIRKTRNMSQDINSSISSTVI